MILWQQVFLAEYRLNSIVFSRVDVPITLLSDKRDTVVPSTGNVHKTKTDMQLFLSKLRETQLGMNKTLYEAPLEVWIMYKHLCDSFMIQ